MNLELLFLLILMILYFLHNIFLTQYFKRKFKKDDNFIGEKAPSELQNFFGKAFYLVLVYYGLVLVSLITGFNFWGLISNITIIDSPIIKIAGFVLGIIFLVLMTLARLNLGSSWRVGLDYNTKDELIKTGFYRYMRNPYFTFLLSFQFTIILISPNAIVIFALIQSYLLLNLQVREEEVFLKEKYGEEYTIYKNRVGRFIPGL
jgi:protein-S-isoprenylcysteine O-methyltransferase Ste14